MDLSPEDALRLNVLLANKPQAIRIHESSMTLYGLTEKGDVQVKLNPNCRDEQYVKRVKEMLSGHVLGSPGGYPVYLQRWTRMGQMREDNLDQLLLLGEPEAVVAVSCAAGITDELARRAWWAMDDAENARRMLVSENVRKGNMGPILAEYLVEHLPFEIEPDVQMTTIAFVLQPGLVSEDVKLDLWKKARRKNSYYVGFLEACPDDLPEIDEPTQTYVSLSERFGDSDDPVVQQLLRTLSPQGQAFLTTVQAVLKKPSTQEVVTKTFDVIARYFKAIRIEGVPDETMGVLENDAKDYLMNNRELVNLLDPYLNEAESYIESIRFLSGLGYGVLRPYLRDTTAIGSLMRKKIDPILVDILAKTSYLAR